MSSPCQPPASDSAAELGVTSIPGGHLLVSVDRSGTNHPRGVVAAVDHAVSQPAGHVLVDLAGLASCDRELADALLRSRNTLAARGRRLVLVNVAVAFRHQLTTHAPTFAIHHDELSEAPHPDAAHTRDH